MSHPLPPFPKPFTIGITTFGGDGGKSGISQYIIALIREFARIQQRFPDRVRFEVVVHEDERDIFVTPEMGLDVVSLPASLRPSLKNILWHQTELPRLCRERQWDAVFLPAGNRRLPFSVPCASVGAVFDFSILHIPGKYSPVHQVYITRFLPVLARRLTRVVTLSESSKRDIVGFAGVPAERVQVIPAAADTAFYRPLPPDTAREYLAERYPALPPDVPYLLYVSRIEHPGKNHVTLIEAFARLKRDGFPHRLVFVGSDWDGSEEVHRAAEESGVSDDIVFTGFAPREDIPYLYAGATLSVFPSRYEGFGLPVLEAMSARVPVACSNVSSLPEVAGDSAALFDPSSAEDMAAVLGCLLRDPAKRDAMAERGYQRSKKFSWERAARETLDTLCDAAGIPSLLQDSVAVLKPEAPESEASREKHALLHELYDTYRGDALPRWRGSLRLRCKQFLWLLVVGGTRLLKRLLDITVSASALLLLAPLMLLVALLIKATDGGPVLFWQQRVGRHGELFAFPKFRSMVVHAEKLKDQLMTQNDHKDTSNITFKMKNDPRITWIGRIIRKLSIDELPQLWCVLKGDMTLVGPRPAVPREVALYSTRDRRRLDVTPGLTCFWQIEGRGDIPFPQQVELDVQYIESQSLWVDLMILARTIPAVLLGKGAY
ncbi:MAG: hypothetical protein OHK0029_12470 [Armatimonadaceae bacterium]